MSTPVTDETALYLARAIDRVKRRPFARKISLSTNERGQVVAEFASMVATGGTLDSALDRLATAMASHLEEHAAAVRADDALDLEFVKGRVA